MKLVFSTLKKPTGFTIVELLVVIVTIGILATITYTGASAVINNSKEQEIKTALIGSRQKIEAYRTKNGVYPRFDQLPAGTVPASYQGNYIYASGYGWCGDGNCFCLEITNIMAWGIGGKSLNAHISSINSNPLPGDCSGFYDEANGTGLTNPISSTSAYGTLTIEGKSPLKGTFSLDGSSVPNGYTGSETVRVALYLNGTLNTSQTYGTYDNYHLYGGSVSWYLGSISYATATTAVVKVEWQSPVNSWEALTSVTLP